MPLNGLPPFLSADATKIAEEVECVNALKRASTISIINSDSHEGKHHAVSMPLNGLPPFLFSKDIVEELDINMCQCP